ncbi:hypothetical protein T35B1_03826 [Salinisphaera shabanensis T35B1]|uniref:hypothetical protein n=1 Tax=Salinisphaera shabanensis TaxID=180542 RepID=UPI00333E4A11
MRRSVIFLAVNVVVLGALAWWLVPEPADPPDIGADTVRAVFEVRDGRRVTGPPVLSARQGGVLEIQIASDRDDELHMHGYDRTWPLRGGEISRLTLVLDQAGRFSVELHHADIELTALEVRPQ